MSWNGAIPRKKRKTQGLRNKRNKNSPKAIAARLIKREQMAVSRGHFEKKSMSDSQWDY